MCCANIRVCFGLAPPLPHTYRLEVTSVSVFFSSRRRHTRLQGDWSSDVCSSDLTTPEAPDLQRVLAGMVDEGVGAVAMEVSSHGPDQHRGDGARFACALFTNLSQDHLDYHGTMEDYFAAKARLFTPGLSSRAAVNLDSVEGRRLADRSARSLVPTLTFGLELGADIVATEVEVSDEGLRFRVGDVEVRSRLRARFNVSNCLGAIAVARQLDIDD